MPIYAYRCEACGFAKDALQKMSDAPLTVCPSCHQPSFKKQLTAAGFQLKGSGWYVTDFRGGDSGGSATKPAEGADAPAGKAESAPAADKASAAATPVASTPPASTPATSGSSPATGTPPQSGAA
ncbi:zinc ribbon domain-containing protein [Herbaspirillum sp. RTI4]|uniref:FmdB family zinc ribbon protein n=1 Tax=Herbaspirillum sp. RTI4 TaxID=3048640 RepID=UPI002AB4198C|nr:FmdB family zinc ribbon protein [Herbaspirillum sp. RTI4]MDY7577127.1 zinc ribbon domain-containing protein [Herbaspirillum sp. RTI4]MEA9982869.1 zinc ribbon domain-containing protein [Herbaspirillum sp. RTI4]